VDFSIKNDENLVETDFMAIFVASINM